MSFYLKWYLYGLRRRPALVVAAFIPLAVFLLMAGTRYDRFGVSLTLPVAGDTPLAVRSSPVAITTVAAHAAEGGQFFAEELTPSAWRRLTVSNPEAGRYDLEQRDQWLALINSLRLEYDGAGGGRVTIAYNGPDLALGKLVTTFSAERLAERIRSGRQRRQKTPGIVAAGVRADDGTTPEIVIGTPKIDRRRAWWRAERLSAAAAFLLLPLAGALVLAGYREFTDPAFKSGRQAARYLDLPILGSLPNLDVLASLLGPETPRGGGGQNGGGH
ncbi:MAG: hypothetical protein JW781_05575 [Deltaproteobacteria bacterium]|nr:hypothetical protein [Candidatus Anaeroferrophillacea bacterium]